MSIRSYRAYTPGTRNRSVSDFSELARYTSDANRRQLDDTSQGVAKSLTKQELPTTSGPATNPGLNPVRKTFPQKKINNFYSSTNGPK